MGIDLFSIPHGTNMVPHAVPVDFNLHQLPSAIESHINLEQGTYHT